MNTILKKLWQDIRRGQNLDVYITIVIALVIAILGVIGATNQNIISSAILATLALVSVSTLLNRHRDEEIKSALLHIEDTSSLSEKFLEQESGRYELPILVERSHKVFLWGMTQWRTIPLLTRSIEQGLETGLEIRFLLLKPNCSAARMAAFRTTHNDINKINSELNINLRQLKDLAKKELPGRLEIRVIDYLAPWTIYAFDPHRPEGQMIVRLTPFRVPNRIRPKFRLSAREDEKWFQYFLSQFEAAWAEAELISLIEE